MDPVAVSVAAVAFVLVLVIRWQQAARRRSAGWYVALGGWVIMVLGTILTPYPWWRSACAGFALVALGWFLQWRQRH